VAFFDQRSRRERVTFRSFCANGRVILRRRPHRIALDLRPIKLLSALPFLELATFLALRLPALSKDMANQVLAVQRDFSLVLGAPLCQLYLRTRLARPPLELVSRRTIAISLICWAPPFFLLALVAGQVFGTARIPFLLSLGAHTRFLLALPLLIGSELIVHERLKSIGEQFLERGIIPSEDRERFEAMVGSAIRLRNSILAEVGIALFVAAISYWVWRDSVVLGASSWYAIRDDRSAHLTAAGIWYAFVSLPILRFILLRWYFRLFVWYRFPWHVRSLPLHLNLFHPDRAGGLGFLSGSVLAFALGWLRKL
jgi:hypothetical protein